MSNLIFAAPGEFPVCAQALGILAGYGFTALTMENSFPEGAIILAPCNASASIPGTFLRKLPEDLTRRKEEMARRGLVIPDHSLEYPNLVAIRESGMSADGSYPQENLPRFRRALEELAGIKPPKKSRNRGRSGRPFIGSHMDVRPYFCAS